MVNSVPCHGSSTLEPGLLHDGGSKPRFESSSQITVRLSGFWSTRMQRRCLAAGFLCLTRLLKDPVLCLRQAINRLQYSTLSASPAVTRPQAHSAHSLECVVSKAASIRTNGWYRRIYLGKVWNSHRQLQNSSCESRPNEMSWPLAIVQRPSPLHALSNVVYLAIYPDFVSN
jgi:hypothetical protein